MGKADQAMQAEQPGRAFDGMRCTENGIELLVTVPVVLNGQQNVFHFCQQFPTFLNQRTTRLLEVHGRSPAAVTGVSRGSPSSLSRLSRQSTSQTLVECCTKLRRVPRRMAVRLSMSNT